MHPDSSSTATFETQASTIARKRSSGELFLSAMIELTGSLTELKNMVLVCCRRVVCRHSTRGRSLPSFGRTRFRVCISAKLHALSNQCCEHSTVLLPLGEQQSHSTRGRFSNLFLFPIH